MVLGGISSSRRLAGVFVAADSYCGRVHQIRNHCLQMTEHEKREKLNQARLVGSNVCVPLWDRVAREQHACNKLAIIHSDQS